MPAIPALKFIAPLVVLTAIASTHANELEQEANKFCEKMKQCTLQSMKGQDMPPNMEAMVMQNLDSACDSMKQQFQPALAANDLYQPAVKCMRSMSNMSCSDFEQMDGSPTRACAEFEKKAESYSQ